MAVVKKIDGLIWGLEYFKTKNSNPTIVLKGMQLFLPDFETRDDLDEDPDDIESVMEELGDNHWFLVGDGLNDEDIPDSIQRGFVFAADV